MVLKIVKPIIRFMLKIKNGISEIIIGLTDHVDSRAIIGQFAKSRVKCGQKCLKGEPCNHCEKIVQLSELLIKANLLIDNK